jgi:hypothetical protein
MAKTLNFNTIKKQYLTITFNDDKKTTVMVGTPTKSIMNEMIALSDSLESDGDNISQETIDELYYVCARVISRNKTGVKIDKEYLEEVFDIEDIFVFFDAYMSFVTALGNEKN